MPLKKSLILSDKEIQQKLIRMAYQIYENNVDEENIAFAGIWDRGYVLAKKIQSLFTKISGNSSDLIKISLDKFTPTQADITLDVEAESLQDKVIILVDDVLNSGKTLAYSLKPFLSVSIKKIETAVLINRDHPTFPLSATYTGFSLSTTIKEHIEVLISEEKIEAYLF